MTFNNVLWNSNDSLDGYKLQKMIINDNNNYQFLSKSSMGYLNDIELSTLTQTTRTLNTNATFKLLSTLNINKKGISNSRYYKVNIGDITIADPEVNDLVSGAPRDTGFVLRFEFYNENSQLVSTTEFLSTLKPARNIVQIFAQTVDPNTVSANTNSSPVFWRSQAGEFVWQSSLNSFSVQIHGSVLVARTGLPAFQLANGRIWIEDVGAAPL
jgi:hypothetical protein